MAAKSQLQSVYNKWSKISQVFQQNKLPDSHWQQLAQQDIKTVEQGGQPLTDIEIYDALSASLGKQPNVQHTNKGVDSPLDLLGNVASDLRSFPENFVTGVASYAASLPTQIQDFIKLASNDAETQKKYGMETKDSGDSPLNLLGKFVRDAARTPVFGPLVPGLQTAASATTDTGRKQLEAHPGYAALDVGAGASEAARMGLLGDAAKAGSPLEALQHGNPYKAAGRGIMDAAAHLPAVPSRAEIFHMLARKGLSSDLLNNVLKPTYVAQRTAEAKAINYIRDGVVKRLDEWGKRDPAQYQAFMEAMNSGNPDKLAAIAAHPEMAAISSEVDMAIDELQRVSTDEGAKQWVETPAGKELYAANSPVAKLDSRVADLTNQASELRNKAVAATGKDQAALIKQFQKVKAKLDKAKSDFHQVALETPSDRWNVPLAQAVRERSIQALKDNVASADDVGAVLHGMTLDSAIKEMSDTALEANMVKWLGADAYLAIKKDAITNWQQMAKDGWNPRYITNVDSGMIDRVSYPKLAPGEVNLPRFFKDEGFNLGHTQNNIAVALTSAESQVLRWRGEAYLYNKIIKPLTTTTVKQEPAYLELARQTNPEHIGPNTQGIAHSAMMKDYVEVKVDSNATPHGWRQVINPTNEAGVLLPVEVAHALDKLAKDGSALHGTRLPGMNLFKVAVLSGPRHMAHIILGGLVMTVVRDPTALRFLRDGWEISKDPTQMPQLFQSLYHMRDPDLYHFAAAKSMGRMLKEIPGALGRVEEHFANTYKASVMLSQEAKGFAPEQAIATANKVLVDMDNMTPFEKQVVRQVFPFWGFTKHVLRYALTLPVDHPLRTAFLANLAKNVQEGDNGSLPGYFNTLFFVGKPDASGNVTSIDIKNVNPFRSLYNEFTLAGVLSSLNPYVNGIMEASGLNVLSASPELHPDLQVDPQSGQLVARRQAESTGLSFGEAFVPELTTIDAALQISNRMKGLSQSNPDAFHRALWTSLNMPFVPGSYNLPHEMQKMEIRRFTQAQKDVSSALKSNDFSYLQGYNQVPVPAYLKPFTGNREFVSPDEMAHLWAVLVSQAPAGVSPKAVLPPPRSTTRR